MTSGLLRHASTSSGHLHHITPENAGWTYTSFDLHRLLPGETLTGTNETLETCAVVVSGSVTFAVDGRVLGVTAHRPGPFDKRPWAAYTPLGSDWAILASEVTEIAICSAPARRTLQPLFIRPDDVSVQKRGSGTNLRYVIDLLPENCDVADRLLVLEAVTPGGNWSSYPPHKHDTARLPEESLLEEVYYHRVSPPSGFAFQRIYTEDRSLDETLSVNDGDVVLVPRGYHPVGAPHGYDLYYLNVMAGPERVWRTHPDPDHASDIGHLTGSTTSSDLLLHPHKGKFETSMTVDGRFEHLQAINMPVAPSRSTLCGHH